MARADNWVKINLFLSSYFPLWIILLIIQLVGNWEVLFSQSILTDRAKYFLDAAIPLVITGLLALLSFLPLRIASGYIRKTEAKENPEPMTIKSTEDLTSEYLLYIITYVFPFMTASSFNELSGIALVGAMIIIAVLYIRGNLFHVNPTLMLLYKYRLYKVVDLKDNTYHLLSKEATILNGKKIRANSLNGIFYIQSPIEPKDNATVLNP